MAKSFQRFTLHVQLEHIEPPIWRRIEVEGTESLRKLHHILQAAFGWEDAHLYSFVVDGTTYATPDVDDVPDFAAPPSSADDRKVRLHKILKPGSHVRYRYDFGDGWEHALVVEKMETIESEPWGAAQIVDGARACPPEDVGGPPGYEAFLSALHDDPQGDEAAQYRHWAGPGFDAEQFDLRAANATLRRMAANRWGKQ
ncbi:plasmid pRiA4b ORF-3 family protein [Pandoraea sputorum]|uniref:Transposase n=1 Tax=Pandoraea sputorum TaxID=93222 RepID=A0A5E5BLP2_9BURK|nr:plasmid pRiA4b ORF-3 family protein [Pandoraea sputorum]VVE85975.1 transposase [Pandoraea sputorum]